MILIKYKKIIKIKKIIILLHHFKIYKYINKKIMHKKNIKNKLIDLVKYSYLVVEIWGNLKLLIIGCFYFLIIKGYLLILIHKLVILNGYLVFHQGISILRDLKCIRLVGAIRKLLKLYRRGIKRR